jgi:hypothetical protein
MRRPLTARRALTFVHFAVQAALIEFARVKNVSKNEDAALWRRHH